MPQVRYVVQLPPPQNKDQIIDYLLKELEKIRVVLDSLSDGKCLTETFVAPPKPRYGLYFADGTHWNPGSGRGLYWFDEAGGTFVFIA